MEERNVRKEVVVVGFVVMDEEIDMGGKFVELM